MASDKPDSFQCGAFEVSRNPDVKQFAEKLNRIREAVDQCRIQPGVGYTINRSINGTVLSIKTGNSSGSVIEEYPFKIQVRKKDNRYQFYSTRGIVGGNEKDVSNCEKWVDFTPPAVIYVSATISNMAVQSIMIKTDTISAEIPAVFISGGEQQGSNKIIATYGSATLPEAKWELVQAVKTNLPLTLVCANGYPALNM